MTISVEDEGSVVNASTSTINIIGDAKAVDAGGGTVDIIVGETQNYHNRGARGDRSSLITVTTDATVATGAIGDIVNGSRVGTLGLTQGESSKNIKFQFDEAKIVTEAIWRQSQNDTHGTWKWRGSTDDVSYTDIGNAFRLGYTPLQRHIELASNTTAYTYYKLEQVSGVIDSSPYIVEVEFKISTSSGAEDGNEYYDNPDGSGYRSDDVEIQTDLTLGGTGLPKDLINGRPTTDQAWLGAGQTSGEFIFGFKRRKVITELKWYQDIAASQGTWQLAGSNDNSTYTNIGSTFALGGTATTTVTAPSANTTAYRFYRLKLTSGTTSSSSYLREIEFKIR